MKKYYRFLQELVYDVNVKKVRNNLLRFIEF
jgi:hypothetical protein